jgi:protein-S-isoprenylcysteine O-methyltransferase Ste14
MMRGWIALYGLHALFWGVFVARALGGRAKTPGGGAAEEAPREAKGARLVVALHGVAIGIMYFGIGDALFARVAPSLFPGQQVAGAIVIVGAAGLALWSLLWFRSWRLAAAVDGSHELATGGPFALVRHPIYLAMDLLAAGSFVWLPSALVLAGVVAVALVGALRARMEERLLLEVFGDRYREYVRRTRGFLPFLY